MSSLPPCPLCGSESAVRVVSWLGSPRFACDDCARAGRGAESYFDAPTCKTCRGDGAVSRAGEGETLKRWVPCPACREADQ